MYKKRKYIKKSADGRFFLCTEDEKEKIDLDKKTKLWISSEYLFIESIKQDIEKTKRILKKMLYWNESMERFEECEKIKQLINKVTSEQQIKKIHKL